MQRYTIFFITVNALHVSGGFFAHHQELKNCTHSIRYVPGLFAATASGIITVSALDVSGGFFAHHQELKNCIHSICYCQACLLLPLAVLLLPVL
jgi:predicted RNase H-like HicB family nuclease